MVVTWLVIGGVLLLFEAHHRAFYAIFAAAGAFVAAGVAAAATNAVLLQIGAAVVVTGVGVATLRPYVSRAFEHRRGGWVARGVHGGLVGEEAMTLDEVGNAHRIGHVRLAGERWLAASEGKPIPAGTRVLVTAVRGTTLVVWPVDTQNELPGSELPGNNGAPDGADGS